MKCKKNPHVICILILLMTGLIPFFPVCAENQAGLSQAYVWDQKIDVFTDSAFDSDNLSVKTSAHASEIIESGLIADKNVTVRTSLLIDISTSIPYATRNKVIEFINYYIESLSKNEQIKIITFGEKLDVLQDFTSDRFDLANAIKKISFDAQQSMIFDALYNSIPKIQPLEGKPCFYRTVIITDGVDLTQTGVTKEELYLKLQAESYPIDTVAVSGEKQSEPDKELSALARISGGKYVNIFPEADAGEIFPMLSENNLFWIRAEIPAALLDGSVRQIDISDGNNYLQFDVKIPIYDVPAPETTEAAASVTTTDVSEPAPAPETSQDENDQSEKSVSFMTLFGDHTPIIYIIAVIIILAAAAVIIVLIKRKNKKLPDNINTVETDDYESKTVFLNPQNNITIIDCDNPSQSWNVNVSKDIIIGRSKDADVKLNEETVARKQCKIIFQNGNFKVINLSETNKTYFNDTVADNISGIPLESGGILKFGHVKLRVNFIKEDENNTVAMLDDYFHINNPYQ